MTAHAAQQNRESLVSALVLLSRYTVEMTEIAYQSLGRDSVENRDIQVLIAIQRFGPQTPTGLGEHTDAPRSTMSRGLTRLESAGLIGRSADPRDGRAVRIFLTARGRRRLSAFSDRLGHFFRSGAPLLKEAFHVLDQSVPDAAPASPIDPLLAAEAITMAGARFVEEARPAIEQYGVNDFADRFTLCLLRRYGIQRPTQIADELRLTPSGTSGVLSRLEGAGLITRRHDLTPGDRRAVVVELTPRGGQAMETMVEVFGRHVPAITRALALTWHA